MSDDFFPLSERQANKVKLVQKISWLSFALCVIGESLRLASEQVIGDFSFFFVAFFGVTLVSFFYSLYNNKYLPESASQKIRVNWLAYKYLWTTISVLILILSLIIVYTIYKFPNLIAIYGLTPLDLLIILLILTSGSLIVRLQRILQTPSLDLPEYHSESGFFPIFSIIAVLTILQAIKISIDVSIAPLLTMITLISAGTGGLANFVMSYARGLKDSEQSETTHKAGGWLLRQAIVLTGSGLSIIPGILNLDIIKEWSISTLSLLNNFQWIKVAFPAISKFLSDVKYRGYPLEDLYSFVGPILVALTLAAISIFAYTIIKVIVGFGHIYAWISKTNGEFKPMELSFSQEYRDVLQRIKVLDEEGKKLEKKIKEAQQDMEIYERKVKKLEEAELPPPFSEHSKLPEK